MRNRDRRPRPPPKRLVTGLSGPSLSSPEQLFFTKLGPSPSRRPYEISVSQYSLGIVMCPSQLDGVQWLHSYRICQIFANVYFGGMSPRAYAKQKNRLNKSKKKMQQFQKLQNICKFSEGHNPIGVLRHCLPRKHVISFIARNRPKHF